MTLIAGSTIDSTLASGESETYAVPAIESDGVRAVVSATGSPYEVELQTTDRGNAVTEIDLSDFSPASQSPATIMDTDEHYVGSAITGYVAGVSITNTGSSEITVTGRIERYPQNAGEESLQKFLSETPSGLESSLSFVDGRAQVGAGSVNADHLLHTKEFTTEHQTSAGAEGTGLTVEDIAGYDDVEALLEAILTDANVSATNFEGAVDINLPYGDFDATDTITLDTQRFGVMRLIGMGHGTETNGNYGTHLVSQITDGTKNLLDDTGGTGSDFAVLKNFAATGSTSEQHGLFFEGNDESFIERVRLVKFGSDGAVLDCSEIDIKGLKTNQNGRHGIQNRGHHCQFRNIESEGNSKVAVFEKGNYNLWRAPFESEQGTNGTWMEGRFSSVRGGRSNDNSSWDTVLKGTGNTIENHRLKGGGSGGSGGGAQIRGTLIGLRHVAFEQHGDGSAHVQVQSSAHRCYVVNCDYDGSAPTKFDLAADATDILIDDPTVNGEQAVAPSSSTYTASFDTAFTHKPCLDVLPDGAAFQGTSNWATDANGNYTGVDLSFSATPTELQWEANPRNVSV